MKSTPEKQPAAAEATAPANPAPKRLAWVHEIGGGSHVDLSPGIRVEINYSVIYKDPTPWKWRFSGLESKKGYATSEEAKEAGLRYVKASLQKALAAIG